MVQVAQAQAGQPFPKGDELGDVGQYYSALSPRKGSATYIQNTSASSQTVNVAIYQDTGGSPVETLVCTVPGNRTLQIDMIDDSGTGTLDVEGYSGGANCGDKTGYHGVYHMKIWSGGNLAVTVRHVIGPAGAYWAVADKFADDYHLLPGIYLCDGSGCWDTEFVVQNTTGTTTNVHFSWNPDDEAGFYDNNEAQLDGNERRSFLASQLMLANTGGGALTQKDFWTVFHLYASGGVEVAVTVNMFYRAYSDGKLKAENPVKHLMQFTTPEVGDVLLFPVSRTIDSIRVANACSTTKSVSATSYDINGNANGSTNINLGAFKGGIINPASFNASSTIHSVKLSTSGACIAGWMWHVDTGGYMGITGQEDGDTGSVFLPTHVSGSSLNQGYAHSQVNQYTNTNSSPSRTAYYMDDGTVFTSGSLTLNGDFDYASTTVTDFPEGFYQRIDKGTGNLFGEASYVHQLGSADNEWAYSGISAVDDTWYVPFAMAPVVEFEWDDTEDANYPSVRFGWAGSPEDGTGERAGTTPAWAKDMNWYEWDKSRTRCEKYARYIPMDWGLGGGSSATYNSEARLKAIKNTVPSACTGRPLLLANEPNYYDQSNMTHVEMARQVFVYRNWPGDLHSQSYGKDYYGSSIGTSHSNANVTNGKTNPTRTDYATFKTYWNNEISGVFGDLPYDSLAVHFYLWRPDVPDGGTMASARQTEIASWRTEAQNLNVKVQVTEYGVFPWQDTSFPSFICNKQCIADRIDELHNGIINNLTLNGVKYYRQLMWYSFNNADCRAPNYCNPPHDLDWRWPSAMELVNGTWQPTNPVGQTWVNDAKGR